MKVALGQFACFCVESRFGANLDAGIQSVVRYYSRRLRSAPDRTAGLQMPGLVETPFVELDVSIACEDLVQLKREARSCSVDIQQLLNHAVFVYFSDLDRDPEILRR